MTMPYVPVWRCNAEPDLTAEGAAWRFAATALGEPQKMDEFGIDSEGRFKLAGGGLYRVQLMTEGDRTHWQVSEHQEALPC